MKKIISAALCLVLITGASGCAQAVPETGTSIVQAEVSYEGKKISFLGPEGTYTQEACEVFFGGEGEYIPYSTVKEAVQALTDNECEYAVIPQENTIGGVVADYADTLISTPEVYVAGEVVLTINQNLLVIPGTSLSDIKTVYSHAQGLTQGREWLMENLPDAEVIEVSSTSEGARMVSEAQDITCAAIASAGCADIYGLDIMAAGIQNNDNNRTRFYVLTTEEPAVEGRDRTAFIVSGSAECLPALMEDFSESGAVLITVHDRPLKTELGQYSYIIECEGLTYEDYLEVTSESGLDSRFLGCYDVR